MSEQKHLDKKQQLELVLSVIGNEWLTYKQIKRKLYEQNNFISTGGISNLLWRNIKYIEDKIEWNTQYYGDKDWQYRMIFRKKQ